MRKSTANLLLVIVTVVWGGGFIATSTALNVFSPFTILMIRFLGAAVLPIILARNAWKTLTKKDILHGIIVGVLLFLSFAFQTFGLQTTTSGKNAFLTATNVIMVPYLLWLFLHKKPDRKAIISSFICILGIALLTLRAEAMRLSSGDMLSFICALFFAMHMIALDRCGKDVDVFAMTALQMLTAGLLAAIFALMFESWPQAVERTAIWSLLYSIFISTMLAYLLQTWAQKYTPASEAALILSMEALWAAVFSYLFLGEAMTLPMLTGAALILCSVLYVEAGNGEG